MAINGRVPAAAVALLLATIAVPPAAGLYRLFRFSVSPPARDDSRAAMHYDVSFGERPFDLVEGDHPEQRFGIQASFGKGFLVLGRVGVAADGSETRSSQQGELLYDF